MKDRIERALREAFKAIPERKAPDQPPERLLQGAARKPPGSLFPDFVFAAVLLLFLGGLFLPAGETRGGLAGRFKLLSTAFDRPLVQRCVSAVNDRLAGADTSGGKGNE